MKNSRLKAAGETAHDRIVKKERRQQKISRGINLTHRRRGQTHATRRGSRGEEEVAAFQVETNPTRRLPFRAVRCEEKRNDSKNAKPRSFEETPKASCIHGRLGTKRSSPKRTPARSGNVRPIRVNKKNVFRGGGTQSLQGALVIQSFYDLG